MLRLRGRTLWFLALVLCAASVKAQAPQDLESLKQQADEAYRERHFQQAIQLCDQVLGQAPTDHVALYLRGSSRVEMGIVSGQTELIRQGIADAREAIRNEGQGKPEYYLPYIYGMSHLAALEDKPVHAKTARTVAESVLDRDDLTDEQRANLYYQRAQADLQLDDYGALDADLAQTLKLSPKHLAAHMLSAEVAAETKSFEEGLAAYTKVVATFPDNPLVYNNRGMYLQSNGRSKEAVADFNKAIQLDNKFIPAYINRGFAYLEAGDAASAETALTQALSVDPEQTGALSLRATARLNQNKSLDALADYRKVAQLAPKNPMAHADLGFAQFFTKDYAAAEHSFEKALELDSNLRFLLPWKLASEMQLGQVDPQGYAAVTSKAENARDWVDHLVLFQLGRLDVNQLIRAVSSTDAKARDAQLCEAYYFVGMELERRGRPNDAKAYFQQAIKQKLPKLSAYRGAVFALGNNGPAAQ